MWTDRKRLRNLYLQYIHKKGLLKIRKDKNQIKMVPLRGVCKLYELTNVCEDNIYIIIIKDLSMITRLYISSYSYFSYNK